MGVTTDQLVRDVCRDFVDRPRRVRVLLRDARVEDDLHEEVAELLTQVVRVTRLDRLDALVGLLEEVGHE